MAPRSGERSVDGPDFPLNTPRHLPASAAVAHRALTVTLTTDQCEITPESTGNSGSVTATAPRSINSRATILGRTRRSQPGQRSSSSSSSSRSRFTSTGIRYASEPSSSEGTTWIACASARSVVGGTSRITVCVPNASAIPSRNPALIAMSNVGS